MLEQHNATVDTVSDIYQRLIGAGAGQVVNHIWVPASGVAQQDALGFLLTSMSDIPSLGPTTSPSEKMRLIAFHLVDHFENRTPLPDLEQ